MNTEMMNAVETLIESIKNDYTSWWDTTKSADNKPQHMIDSFNNSIEVRPGNKYIKIVTDRSVWGFIVNTDNDKKFKRGDILMAASFSAPARNKPRGNVLEEGYKVQWTGPLYLN